MARSVLASTISILSSVVLKNGQPAAISRSRPLSSKEERARPTPYQPGSMIRACAQLNTQGMARRSSMRVDFVREAGRRPIFRPDISRMGVARSDERRGGKECVTPFLYGCATYLYNNNNLIYNTQQPT